MRLNFTKNLLIAVLFALPFFMGAQTVNIDSPASIAGEYEFGVGTFGLSLTDAGTIDGCGTLFPGATEEISGEIAIAMTGDGGTTLCEETLPIVSDLTGKIALIDRGDCFFIDKVFFAQEEGAIAVLVCNNVDSGVLNMAPGVDRPVTVASIFFAKADCDIIKAEIAAGNTVDLTIAPSGTGVIEFVGPDAREFVEFDAPPNSIWYEDFESYSPPFAMTSESTDPDNEWTWMGISTDYVDEEGVPIEPTELEWDLRESWKTFFYGLSVWAWDFESGDWDFLLRTEGGYCSNSIMFDGTQTLLLDAGADNSGQRLPLRTEFISPTLDMSGQANLLLTMAMCASQEGAEPVYFVSASNDNGATWGDEFPIVASNFFLDTNGPLDNEQVNIPIFGVNGTSQTKIKFIVDGDDGYQFQIDDIYLSPLVGANAALTDVFYSPLSYAVPQSEACGDIYSFAIDVENRGADVINNAMFTATVYNDGTGEEVFSTTGSSADALDIQGTVIINGDSDLDPSTLAIGRYRIDYVVSLVDQEDVQESDNTVSRYFEITDNKYAKEDGTGLDYYVNVDADQDGARDPWGFGAIYTTCATASVTPVASGITITVSSDSTLVDNYVEYSLIELPQDEVDAGYPNFPLDNTDIFSNPFLSNIVYQDIYTFTESDVPGDFFNLPIPNIPLNSGATYMVFISFDATQGGNAEQANSDLFLGFSNGPTKLGGAIPSEGKFGLFFSDFNFDSDQFFLFDNIIPVARLCIGEGSPNVPVEFGSISATGMEDHIELDWNTFTEVNNEGFDVERSVDGKDFSKIGFVEGKLNSTRENIYKYADRDIDANVTYYYRLKQIDTDGRFEYSDIVNANITKTSGTVIKDVYPNPSNKNGVTYVDILSDVPSTGTYQIVDQQGRTIVTNGITVNKGLNTIELQTSILTTGVYVINIQSGALNAQKKLIIVE